MLVLSQLKEDGVLLWCKEPIRKAQATLEHLLDSCKSLRLDLCGLFLLDLELISKLLPFCEF